MIKQHRYKWLILYYALLGFLTDKPHEYFEREYGPSRRDYKWVPCHEGEIGLTSYGLRVLPGSLKEVIRLNHRLIKEKLIRIMKIIKE
jgi:hypothetical protein